MMLDEQGENDPGTDMRLAISFNQLGVGYLMNDGVYYWSSGLLVANRRQNAKRQKSVSSGLSKR